MGSGITTGVTTIVTGMGDALSFIIGLFSSFLGQFTSNALLFVPVGMAILFGGIGIAKKLVKRFGVRGRR